MADVIYSGYTVSSYNSNSLSHTPAVVDNFVIVVTWQNQISVGGAPPTPGAPTYGGEALDYVGWSYRSGPGGINSSHLGIWAYAKLNCPPGTNTATFTPTAGYRPWIACITGKFMNPTAEDIIEYPDAGGGSFSYTLTPITVGALTLHLTCGEHALSGDGTTLWNEYHDEADNRWDAGFECEYYIATDTSKTYDGLFAGSAGLLGLAFPYKPVPPGDTRRILAPRMSSDVWPHIRANAAY